MEKEQTGILLNPANIKLHRVWFKNMCKLIGINVLYRAPIEGTKQYNLHGELEAYYEKPVTVGVIFDEHPTNKTMHKLGWNAELADSSVLIHVPYDLQKLQAGGVFIIPSGLDGAPDRLFKVLRMNSTAVYPASISCELGPVLLDKLPEHKVEDFTESTFNLLKREDGYNDNVSDNPICVHDLVFEGEKGYE